MYAREGERGREEGGRGRGEGERGKGRGEGEGEEGGEGDSHQPSIHTESHRNRSD